MLFRSNLCSYSQVLSRCIFNNIYGTSLAGRVTTQQKHYFTNHVSTNRLPPQSVLQPSSGQHVNASEQHLLSRTTIRRFHDDEQKTYATMINKEEGSYLMVDAYSQVGFRLNNGLGVVGPIALFPKSIMSWNVRRSSDITKESLSLFYMLAPKIDILVLGIGDAGEKFDFKLLLFLRDKGISLELLPTEKAVSTFNFLNSERRNVAGAFLPPRTIHTVTQDIIETLQQKNELFKSDMKDEFI